MLIILKVLGLLLLCVAVYWVNPLNDPNNPESRQNYYHPENIQAREGIARERRKDPDQIILNWNEALPFMAPTIVTLICSAVVSLIH